MTDLDAIRARHQPVAGLRDDEGHLFEPATFCRHCVTLWPCDADALLAEVDRLTARWESASVGYIRDTERARIRAAVEGLVPVMVRKDMLVPDPKWDDMVTRAAVLAAIEGGEHE